MLIWNQILKTGILSNVCTSGDFESCKSQVFLQFCLQELRQLELHVKTSTGISEKAKARTRRDFQKSCFKSMGDIACPCNLRAKRANKYPSHVKVLGPRRVAIYICA